MNKFSCLLSLVTLASCHGIVTTPIAIRTPGEATAALCSQTMVDFYKTDNTSYPEHLLRTHPEPELLADGYNPALCNMWLCKGFQFEDNAHQVQSYKPGDVIDMEIFIRIPHLGYANVSIVDTASNKVVGDMLKVWEDGYADAALFPNLPKDQTNFNLQVPELGGKCTTPGECVSTSF